MKRSQEHEIGAFSNHEKLPPEFSENIETETLEIIKQFNALCNISYEQIEHTGDQPMQFEFLKNWIKNLTEQNCILVETMQNLEKEAIKNVILNNLHQSKNVNEKIEVHDNEYSRLKEEVNFYKCRLSHTENELEDLRCYVKQLKQEFLKLKNMEEKTNRLAAMESEMDYLKRNVRLKEELLQAKMDEVKSFQQNLYDKQPQASFTSIQVQTMDGTHQEMENLKKMVQRKDFQLETARKTIFTLQNELEILLTHQVSEDSKFSMDYDMIQGIQLKTSDKSEINILKEKLSSAFDVIKYLRKEVKIARSQNKFCSASTFQMKCSEEKWSDGKLKKRSVETVKTEESEKIVSKKFITKNKTKRNAKQVSKMTQTIMSSLTSSSSYGQFRLPSRGYTRLRKS